MICAACLLQGCLPGDPAKPADWVFRGGAVYTVNPDMPWAQAVAVSDGKIVYVGDDKGVEQYAGENTRFVDIAGGMLMPGFNDAHMHPMSAGTSYLRCPLNEIEELEIVLEKLGECAGRLVDGEWLRATGLQDQFFENSGPGIGLLDEVSGGRPALVSSWNSTKAWVNSLAIEAINLTPDTPDPITVKLAETPKPEN